MSMLSNAGAGSAFRHVLRMLDESQATDIDAFKAELVAKINAEIAACDSGWY